MARLIPRELPSGLRCSREVALLFRVLRKLDDNFTIRFSLEPTTPPRPHFFALYRERFAFLIQVAETSQQLAESAVQSDFLSDQRELTPDALGADEAGTLAQFAASIEERYGPLAEGGLPMRKLVVFPNVLHRTVDEVVLQRSLETEVQFLGLKQLPAGDFNRRLVELAETALPEPALIHLRSAFSPDTIVPADFSPLRIRERDTAATLTGRLLDLDQEWCVNNDLYLPPESERLAEEGGCRTQLVTGVAGCGKSLVLLYRALKSARLNPRARVLVLTHNRPLRSELERRFGILSDRNLHIDWLTFFQWASRCLGNWPEEHTLTPRQCERLIESLLVEHPKLASSNPEYLLDEIGWIKDHNLRTREGYLAADRQGRGRTINREAVWELFRSYQNELQARNAIDWPGVAMRFHEAAAGEGRLAFPCYEFIFVDEAQFFAKSWFEVVRAALVPGGHLFLAADPTQGFLRRRQSWLASGIEVRGRTTRLNHPYRNSRAILRFAARFYQARAALAPETHREDDLNLPTAEQIEGIDCVGVAPEIVPAASDHEALVRAGHEIVSLHRESLPPGQILLLHTAQVRPQTVDRHLVETLGDRCLVHDAKTGPLPPAAFCQHTTLNAATGIEAPIVILLGIDALLESEGDPRLTAEECGELLRDHTRQLYMAFTRAGQRLVILCQSERTREFLSSLLAD